MHNISVNIHFEMLKKYIYFTNEMCIIMSICEQLYMYICCHEISNKSKNVEETGFFR